MADGPIEGQVLLVTAAKASVPPRTIPELVARVQAQLDDRRASYDRAHERVVRTGGFDGYLVDAGHWDEVGAAAGLDGRETDAVRRAHREQLLHTGRREGREAEFEAALEIREPVLIGRE
jgi:hypothetical protein